MAYHKCGYFIEDIPHNDTGFLTNFTKYCPKCGKRYEEKDLEVFVGAKVWNGIWWNPLTWFKFKIIERE